MARRLTSTAAAAAAVLVLAVLTLSATAPTVRAQYMAANSNLTCAIGTGILDNSALRCTGDSAFPAPGGGNVEAPLAGAPNPPIWKQIALSTSPNRPGSTTPNEAMCGIDSLYRLWCVDSYTTMNTTSGGLIGTATHPIVIAWQALSLADRTNVSQVALGWDFGCLIQRADTDIMCWGNFPRNAPSSNIRFSGFGQVAGYQNTFSYITAAADRVCAILIPNGFLCWTRDGANGVQFLIGGDSDSASRLYDNIVLQNPDGTPHDVRPNYGHIAISTDGLVVCAIVKDGRQDPYLPFRSGAYPQSGDIQCWYINGFAVGSRVGPPLDPAPIQLVNEMGDAVVLNHGYTQLIVAGSVHGDNFDGVAICALGSFGSDYDSDGGAFGGPRMFCNTKELTLAWGAVASQPLYTHLNVASGTQFCAITTISGVVVKCIDPNCVYDLGPAKMVCAPRDAHSVGLGVITITPPGAGKYYIGTTSADCPEETLGGIAGQMSFGLGFYVTPLCGGLHRPNYGCTDGTFYPFLGSKSSKCVLAPPGTAMPGYYPGLSLRYPAPCGDGYRSSAGAISCGVCPQGFVVSEVIPHITDSFPRGAADCVGCSPIRNGDFVTPSYVPPPRSNQGIGSLNSTRSQCAACLPVKADGTPLVNPAGRFSVVCPPGFGPFPRDLLISGVAYTDPLDTLRNEQDSKTRRSNDQIGIAAGATFGALVAIAVLIVVVGGVTGKNMLVKVDLLWFAIPFSWPRRPPSAFGGALSVLLMAAAAFILASSAIEYRDVVTIITSLQPKYLAFTPLDENIGEGNNGTRLFKQSPLVVNVSFIVPASAIQAYCQPATASQYINISTFGLASGRNIPGFPDAPPPNATYSIDNVAILNCHRDQFLDYDAAGLRNPCEDSYRACVVSLVCEGCTLTELTPSVSVSFFPRGVAAAAIRVGVSVPYFDSSSDNSRNYSYQLAANVVPKDRFSQSVLIGQPSVVRVALTTAVRADTDALADRVNPKGMIAQLLGTLPGDEVSQYSEKAAQSVPSVGVVIQFNQAPNVFIVQATRSQSGLNFAAQLLALWSGALAVAINFLVVYNWYVWGPSLSNEEAAKGGTK